MPSRASTERYLNSPAALEAIKILATDYNCLFLASLHAVICQTCRMVLPPPQIMAHRLKKRCAYSSRTTATDLEPLITTLKIPWDQDIATPRGVMDYNHDIAPAEAMSGCSADECQHLVFRSFKYHLDTVHAQSQNPKTARKYAKERSLLCQRYYVDNDRLDRWFQVRPSSRSPTSTRSIKLQELYHSEILHTRPKVPPTATDAPSQFYTTSGWHDFWQSLSISERADLFSHLDIKCHKETYRTLCRLIRFSVSSTLGHCSAETIPARQWIYNFFVDPPADTLAPLFMPMGHKGTFIRYTAQVARFLLFLINASNAPTRRFTLSPALVILIKGLLAEVMRMRDAQMQVDEDEDREEDENLEDYEHAVEAGTGVIEKAGRLQPDGAYFRDCYAQLAAVCPDSAVQSLRSLLWSLTSFTWAKDKSSAANRITYAHPFPVYMITICYSTGRSGSCLPITPLTSIMAGHEWMLRINVFSKAIQTATEQGCSLLDAVKEHRSSICIDSRAGTTVFAWIHKQRKQAKGYRDEDQSAFTITPISADGTTWFYNDQEVDFQKAIAQPARDLVADAEAKYRALCDKIGIVEEDEPKWKAIIDDLEGSFSVFDPDPGRVDNFQFDREIGPDRLGRNRDFCHRDPLNPENVVWQKGACSDLAADIRSFMISLAAATHATSGQPPRGTELSATLYRDIPTRARNFVIINNRGVLCSGYHKPGGITSQDSCVVRALCDSTFRLTVSFILLIKPIDMLLSQLVFNLDSSVIQHSRSFLYYSGGYLLQTEDVTNALVDATYPYAFGVRDWRQNIAHVGRVQVVQYLSHRCRDLVQPPSPFTDFVSRQGSNPQKRPQSSLVPSYLDLRSLHMFLRISHAHHSVLGVDQLVPTSESSPTSCGLGFQVAEGVPHLPLLQTPNVAETPAVSDSHQELASAGDHLFQDLMSTLDTRMDTTKGSNVGPAVNRGSTVDEVIMIESNEASEVMVQASSRSPDAGKDLRGSSRSHVAILPIVVGERPTVDSDDTEMSVDDRAFLDVDNAIGNDGYFQEDFAGELDRPLANALARSAENDASVPDEDVEMYDCNTHPTAFAPAVFSGIRERSSTGLPSVQRDLSASMAISTAIPPVQQTLVTSEKTASPTTSITGRRPVLQQLSLNTIALPVTCQFCRNGWAKSYAHEKSLAEHIRTHHKDVLEKNAETKRTRETKPRVTKRVKPY